MKRIAQSQHQLCINAAVAPFSCQIDETSRQGNTTLNKCNWREPAITRLGCYQVSDMSGKGNLIYF